MILVTGATGTVGSEVVRALKDRNVRFIAGVHSRPCAIDDVESRHVDFIQPQTLGPALEGASTVFLLSPGVASEHAMVDAARRAGVERIVKLSAFRCGEVDFLAGRVHRDVERAIERSGIAWTFLRPNFFMQNIVTVAGGGIREQNAIYDSIDDARISHIDARDIGRVAAHVLTEDGHEGKVYELSGPQALTNDEIAEILTRTLGRPIRYVRISDDELRRRFLDMGVPEEEATVWVDVSRCARTGADSLVTTSTEDVTSRPPTSFAEFCRDYAHVLQADGSR